MELCFYYDFDTMKKILVPLDHSTNAQAAYDYALALSKLIGIEMFMLLHVQKSTIPKSIDTSQESNRLAGASILDELTDKAENALGDNVTVVSKVLRGEPAEVIRRVAKQIDVDLIVMGALGDDHVGQKDTYLGSVGGEMFKETTLPLLFVPDGFKFEPIKNIAFVLKSLMVYRVEALRPLIDIANAFDATIEVVQMKPSSLGSEDGPDTNIDLAGRAYTVDEVDCQKIPDCMSMIIDKYSPQVLCVLRRKRDFFERIFKSSDIPVEDLYSPLPLLVLQGVR